MKILLTGAKGQVGQSIVNASLQFTHELVACDRHTLDITDIDQVRNIIQHHRPSVVINVAAYTAVDKAEVDKTLAFAVNATGPENLSIVCANAKIPLIHLSTDYVFDGKKQGAYDETDLSAPLSIYGESKWQGEQAIRKYCEKYFILRVSWIFSEYGHNFLKTMLKLMQEREMLQIVSDQKGNPTYAGDIAKVVLMLCEKDAWGTYHYCGSPETTWFEFARVIQLQAKKYRPLRVKNIQPITTAEYPLPALRPQNSVLNCSKIQKTFGLTPSPWQIGLESCIKKLLG